MSQHHHLSSNYYSDAHWQNQSGTRPHRTPDSRSSTVSQGQSGNWPRHNPSNGYSNYSPGQPRDCSSAYYAQGQPEYNQSRFHFWRPTVNPCRLLRTSTEDVSPRKSERGVLDQKIESKPILPSSSVHGLTSVKDKDVEGSIIVAQGQRAVFIDPTGKGTRQSHAPSDHRSQELMMKALQQGHTVDQSICNNRVKKTLIIGQGQDAQVSANLEQFVQNGNPMQIEKFEEVMFQEQLQYDDFDDGDL